MLPLQDATALQAFALAARFLLFQPEFLNLARDGVAPDAQPVSGLDAALVRRMQGRADEGAFAFADERFPDVVSSLLEQQLGCMGRPCFQSVARVWVRSIRACPSVVGQPCGSDMGSATGAETGITVPPETDGLPDAVVSVPSGGSEERRAAGAVLKDSAASEAAEGAGAPAVADSVRTSGGRSLTSTICDGDMTVSQWQMFSSWRTLPGKLKAERRCMA